ncbi:MAG: hypothetical protein M3461_03290 [Pseudomonadota bacterium]|nr:hypothetical protein [Pseudomonadota bacterium]
MEDALWEGPYDLIVNGEAGSVYKGLAITPFSSGNRLYAANFGLRRIDAFDGAYQPILNGASARPADGLKSGR